MQKVRRMAALLFLAAIVGLITVTIVCAVTGSEYFFAMFFLMIAVPVVLWVYIWFARLVSGDSSGRLENQDLKRGSESEESDSEKIGEDKV